VGGGVPAVASLGGDQEVVEVVEAEVGPAVGEVGRRLQQEHLLEVLVVLLVGLVGLRQEAEPHSPLVQKQRILKHIIMLKIYEKVETSISLFFLHLVQDRLYFKAYQILSPC
jgi:hypothetical protein